MWFWAVNEMTELHTYLCEPKRVSNQGRGEGRKRIFVREYISALSLKYLCVIKQELFPTCIYFVTCEFKSRQWFSVHTQR
jgi:hypothetical protein